MFRFAAGAVNQRNPAVDQAIHPDQWLAPSAGDEGGGSRGVFFDAFGVGERAVRCVALIDRRLIHGRLIHQGRMDRRMAIAARASGREEALAPRQGVFATLMGVFAAHKGVFGAINGSFAVDKGVFGTAIGMFAAHTGMLADNKGLCAAIMVMVAANKGLSGAIMGMCGAHKGLSGAIMGICGANKGLSGTIMDMIGGNMGLLGTIMGMFVANMGLSGQNNGCGVWIVDWPISGQLSCSAK
jgi:hypothetical protein